MTAKILRDKFEAGLLALQNICPHLKVSDWMEWEYAPGHNCGIVSYQTQDNSLLCKVQ